MSCSDYNSLHEILTEFDDLVAAIRCAYTSDAMGAGLELAVLSLFFFGFLGLGLSIRTQHPGPILVAGMLSAGTVAATLPGIAAKIFALILFFGLSALGLYLYQRAKRTL